MYKRKIQSFNHSIIQSFNHSIIQSFNHSIIQSFNHSIRLLWVLVFVALVFLFQCGKSDDDPPPTNVKLSASEVTFSYVDGAVGATYTISVSRPPSSEKTVEVTLTSANSLLVVSPTEVTFTPTSASPQTITVKRANDANDIITTEIIGVINHDIVTGTSHDAEFTEFAMMRSMVNVTVTPYIPDSDGDGLVEIWTATMLDNMRYDLAGTSYKTSATDAGDSKGCPDTGCNGYELMANIDLLPLLDANTNGEIDFDMTTVTVADVMHTVIDVNEDTSWSPVGDNSTGDDASRFTGTFEGNGNTIANLWVNISSSGGAYVGLFGVTGGSAEIHNVGVISGGVSASSSDSSSSSGGLVGNSSSSLTITNSYFSGEGGVSVSADLLSYSGGLVGSSFSFSSSSSSSSSSSLTITNSYFSGEGGVSSSTSSSFSHSGGLVGSSDAILMITNSYFSGSGGVSVSAGSLSFSGGLVGRSFSLTIRNSYFSGSGGVSSSSSSGSSPYSGGLVGRSFSLTIRNSYFSGSGGVSSSSSSGSSPYSGGLVGFSSSSLTVTNSYFSGEGGVSSSSAAASAVYSGGLVGFSSNTPVIMNSYWNTDAPQSTDGSPQSPKRARGDVTANPMGAVGLTLAELQATGGTFPDLGDAWDLGTDQQNPAVKQCILDMAGTGCASPAMYGALLGGQRQP